MKKDLSALLNAAMLVVNIGGAPWERAELDRLVSSSYDVVPEPLTIKDSTRYDPVDVLNALFSVWREVYEGGELGMDGVRAAVQRALVRQYDGDPIASIDAGVDDYPIQAGDEFETA